MPSRGLHQGYQRGCLRKMVAAEDANGAFSTDAVIERSNSHGILILGSLQ